MFLERPLSSKELDEFKECEETLETSREISDVKIICYVCIIFFLNEVDKSDSTAHKILMNLLKKMKNKVRQIWRPKETEKKVTF